MSHDLITVSPHTLFPDLAREFRIHRFNPYRSGTLTAAMAGWCRDRP